MTGYDQHGFPFQRVSSVSFSSVVPGQCRSLFPKLRRQCEQFYIFVYLFPSRRPQGADASNNKRLLPSEWGRQMPNREPDPLHAALQHGWEATWGRPVLQVRRTVSEFYFMIELNVAKQDTSIERRFISCVSNKPLFFEQKQTCHCDAQMGWYSVWQFTSCPIRIWIMLSVLVIRATKWGSTL